MTRLISIAILLCFSAASLAGEILLPRKPDSLKFAVIGDTGTGDRVQYEVASELTKARQAFPYSFVVMMGDNMYGADRPKDFEKKFERPYQALLASGMKFYACLGNHDDPGTQRSYKLFGMGGESYYTFRPKMGVRFFALDSNYMDKRQLSWLEQELRNSGSEWKICFFHHPLYSSGERHGPSVELREVLEPLFVKYGVNLVLTGHEHFYERLKPQKNITYFISGAGGKLRKGNIGRSEQSAKGFDEDLSFMLMEIDGNQLHFQTISRKGNTVDSGVIVHTGWKAMSEKRDQGSGVSKTPTLTP
jgi:hypothetical protein